jgi:hypothetical protein
LRHFFRVLFFRSCTFSAAAPIFRPWANTDSALIFVPDFYFNPVQPPNLVRVVFDRRKMFSFLFCQLLILPNSGCSIFSSWDSGLATLWISPAFSVTSNMAQNDLV